MPRLCLEHIIKIMPNIEAVSLWRKSMCSAFLAANVRAGKSLQSDRGNPWTPKARNLTYSISINAKRDITRHTRTKIDELNRWGDRKTGSLNQWSVSKSEILCQINVRRLGNKREIGSISKLWVDFSATLEHTFSPREAPIALPNNMWHTWYHIVQPVCFMTGFYRMSTVCLVPFPWTCNCKANPS